MSITIVVPSLKISGGIREALRLSSELSQDGLVSVVLSLWKSPHSMKSVGSVEHLSNWAPRVVSALFQLPVLIYRFSRWRQQRARNMSAVVFTHYATLPMACLVPRSRRFFFVQDLEWNFVGNGLLSSVLRWFVLWIYRSGQIISANAYLSRRLTEEGLRVALQVPIWADSAFLSSDATVIDIDFAMVLRKGDHKRLDLYLHFIELAKAHGLRVAAITPEEEIAHKVRDEVTEVLLRADLLTMRALYARTACFIHLSDHEGFGLPPLEAMGAGCIPICRDSGGVRAFMLDGPAANLLMPLEMSVEELFHQALSVIKVPISSERRLAMREHFQRGLANCEHKRKGLASALLKDD